VSGLALPVVIDPTWSSTGSMAMARSSHTATLLSAARVIVTGGYSLNGIVGSGEIRDAGSGTWSAVGAMTAERYTHDAVLLANGQVVVSGGYATNGNAMATCVLVVVAACVAVAGWTTAAHAPCAMTCVE
jgi:hypothetical protein